MYSQMPRPSFSVIIPTRNRRAFARRAVACALAQEDVDVEVLLVDDGSTDGSREDLALLRDPRVRLLDGRGAGPCAARNLAVGQAGAPWVAFLDDDDLWAPRKLLLLSERGASCGFGYSTALVTDEHGRTLRLDAAPDPEHLELQLLQRNAIGTPSVVIARTELGCDVGIRDERGVDGLHGPHELDERLCRRRTRRRAADPARQARRPLPPPRRSDRHGLVHAVDCREPGSARPALLGCRIVPAPRRPRPLVPQPAACGPAAPRGDHLLPAASARSAPGRAGVARLLLFDIGRLTCVSPS
ncbi:MAG: glycosyltransferase family 2 protein [Actinobacteria bacterium]|nr:glycosyltransferase family 2 protein [Actinomycetota bacterium]